MNGVTSFKTCPCSCQVSILVDLPLTVAVPPSYTDLVELTVVDYHTRVTVRGKSLVISLTKAFLNSTNNTLNNITIVGILNFIFKLEMERKLLIKNGIEVNTGQAITENHFKEMIDTIAVIRKPVKWFQEQGLEKN